MIEDHMLLNLICQYLRRTAERGGLFWESKQGDSTGLFIEPPPRGVFSGRAGPADDEAIAALLCAPSWTTFWCSLRRAGNCARRAAESNQVLASLGLEKHPDKDFIGRIERGFDFLGYRFQASPNRNRNTEPESASSVISPRP